MLKIKIPPRSEPEKTEAVPLKQGTEDNAVTQFRDWWQEEFEEPAWLSTVVSIVNIVVYAS